MTAKYGPNLGLDYGYDDGESGWGAGYSASHLKLDALVHLLVLSQGDNTPPSTPANGDRYILGSSPTGAWSGKAANVAVWFTAGTSWMFHPPLAGLRAWVDDESAAYRYSGSAWVADSTYTLPAATSGVRGGVKVGTHLAISGDVLSVDTAALATDAELASAISTAVAALVAGAPGALDTLNELAAALGNDASFAATIATALALKAPLASPALTGNPTATTQTAGNNSTRLATTAYADAAAAAVAAGAVSTFAALTDAFVLTSQGSKAVRVNSGATALEPYSPPYDLALYVESTMSNSETVMRFVAPRAFSLPSGAAGSYGKAATAATGSTTLTLAKNGTSFGTLVWSAAGTVAAVTIASATSFAAGDVLTIDGPATADATLANIAITLAGSRA